MRDPDALVIGADQLLVCEGAWFDKPRDQADAAAQLRALRGRTHTLVTAVACLRGGAAVWRHVARRALRCARSPTRSSTPTWPRRARRCLASVGAYRLEGLGIQLFDAVDGEHAAILGLPLLPLLGFLRQAWSIRGVLRPDR